ncbi:T9SS type A sorting domain-containing protein [Spirosoma sp.]|uniref:T9SS type A sorting domain-containing protein n=1 Tax=Spirosoma sp. TaxID=1899569 RepID=UPI003B3BDD98
MEIKWSTSQETRNNVFLVLRSDDFVTFTNIGQVSSQGSGVANRAYTFYDRVPPQTGMLYYSVQAVDLDGNRQSTPVISLFRQPDHNPFVIYNDVVGDIVTLGFTGTTYATAVKITNLLGVALIQQELIRDLVVVRTLDAGVYIMEVTTNTGEVLRRRYLKSK